MTDILGAGIANLVYEFKLYPVTVAYCENFFALTSQNVQNVKKILNAIILSDGLGCILTFLRATLNEYSTGICVLTTAVYRYLRVCHPHMVQTFHKKVAIGILLWVFGTLVATVIDLVFNYSYHTPSDSYKRRFRF